MEVVARRPALQARVHVQAHQVEQVLELVGKEVEGGGGADGGEEVGERGLQVAQVEGALLGVAALGRVELEGLGLRGGGGGSGAVAVGAQEADYTCTAFHLTV